MGEVHLPTRGSMRADSRHWTLVPVKLHSHARLAAVPLALGREVHS